MPRLENWCVTCDNPFQAPEARTPRLHGKVFNHPKFEDGKSINTSGIMAFNSEENKIIVRSGKLYELGEVDPNYEKEFPNAYERLIKSLPRS